MATKTNGNGAAAGQVAELAKQRAALAAELQKLHGARVDVRDLDGAERRAARELALTRALEQIDEDLGAAQQAAAHEAAATRTAAQRLAHDQAVGELRAALQALVAEFPRIEELAGAVIGASAGILRAGGYSRSEAGAASTLLQAIARVRTMLPTTDYGRELLGLAPEPTAAARALSEAKANVKRAETALAELKSKPIKPGAEQFRDNAVRTYAYAALGARRRLAALEGRKADDADWSDEDLERWVRRQLEGGTVVFPTEQELRDAADFKERLKWYGADQVLTAP